jgi:hypothetical protein
MLKRHVQRRTYGGVVTPIVILLVMGLLSMACSDESTAPPVSPTPITPTTPAPAPVPVNRAPTIAGIELSPDGVAVATVTVVTLTANAADPDGDALTYDWNFGDGTSAANAGATTQHVFGGAGVAAVSVTVDDGRGASAMAHVPVTGVVMTGTWRGCALSGTGIQTFEMNQNGPTVAGTYKVPTLQVPFSGALSHPRQLLIRIFDGQMQPWTLDPTGNTIVWTPACTMSRQ